MPEDAESDLDYRFTLANERTFLAWVRTGLGLVAGGVAVEQYVTVGPSGTTRVVGLVALVMGMVVAAGGWVHWHRVQRAMESHTRLPRQPMAAVLAFGVAALALALVVAILTGS
ncbi:MAG: DUF202 domain-containing protein [Candidatus Nanopelagicales bacterium]